MGTGIQKLELALEAMRDAILSAREDASDRIVEKDDLELQVEELVDQRDKYRTALVHMIRLLAKCGVRPSNEMIANLLSGSMFSLAPSDQCDAEAWWRECCGDEAVPVELTR